MCHKLIQIYQKRTPTFLAEITILVAALLLLLRQPPPNCAIHSHLYAFYAFVLALALAEIFLKLVVFALIYSRNREIVNTYNTVVLILVALAHLALWIYAISLLSDEELQVCHVRDRYFMKCYVLAYGTMIVGGGVLFVLLMIPAVGVTLMAIRNSNKQGDAEEDPVSN